MKKNTCNLLVIISLLFLFSCSDSLKEEFTDPVQSGIEKNYVDIKEAVSIANLIEFTEPAPNNASNRSISVAPGTMIYKQIKNAITVPDDVGNGAYHIINYENGGFIIIAGDKRANPILAFSYTDLFPTDLKEYPNGLVEWLANTESYIRKIRANGKSRSVENNTVPAEAWMPCAIQRLVAEESTSSIDKSKSLISNDCGGGCPNSTFSKGPLLQTTWGQGVGYNDALQNLSCERYNNQRPPTGCVATAMAQIMRYYSFPAGYNWSAMLNNRGSAETARLMRDIGDVVDMKYACDGSWTDTEKAVVPAFKNSFGYSSAQYSDYNQNTVKSQLNGNRPVILKGGRKSKWWIFAVYKDGHAWVCDGYRSTINYSSDCSNSWTSLFLRMNWGWGSYLDGWFAFDNWNPHNEDFSGDFNYKRGMVYNIKP